MSETGDHSVTVKHDAEDRTAREVPIVDSPHDGSTLHHGGSATSMQDVDAEKLSGLESDRPQIQKWRLITLTTSSCLGLFLSLLDTSIVATALYSIGTEFQTLESINWVALAYILSYLGCAVLFARFSDVIGRRNAQVSAFVIFIALSIACGFARNLNELIAFRTIQGIAGSGLYSLSMIVLPEAWGTGHNKAIGSVIGLVIVVAGVMGPVVGGVITHETTWRWIFWINGPIGVLALVLSIISWPPAGQMHSPPRSSIASVDFVGAFLLVAASVLVVFAFQEAGLGTTNSIWQQGIFIGPIVAGCVCWILLVAWEAFINKSATVTPLLPPRLLAKRIYTAGTLCTITTGFVYFVVIYSLPIHFQTVYGKSSLIAGVSLLPLLGSAAIGTVMGGMVPDVKGARFWAVMSAAVLQALGAGLLATVSAQTVQNKVYGFQVLVGLGFGISVSNISVLATRVSEKRDTAVAQGIVAQARVLGGSIGIAASTAILGVTQRRELAGIPPEALASLESGSRLLTTQQLTAVRQAYVDSFVETMWVTAIVAGVGFLCSFGLFERRDSKHPAKQRTKVEAERTDTGTVE